MTEKELLSRLQELIPGGAHTYSRGNDQFPRNAPAAIIEAKGYLARGSNGTNYIDLGMGLRSVSIGHGDKKLAQAIYRSNLKGVNFTRPNLEELQLAEKFCELIPSAEMVKFAKNGSDVTTAATKLARAFTGKRVILRCLNNPFFSVDDWFISNTPMDNGIPAETSSLTIGYQYGNMNQIRDIYKKLDGDVACIILEPFGVPDPDIDFLRDLRTFCTQQGIVLIFDEVISGFRYHLKGAQFLAGVTPDLSTFGKAVGNGFPISALCGKREIMELGGIGHISPRVFLLSTTFGSERSGLTAALWTISKMEKNPNFEENYEVATFVKSRFNKIAESLNVHDFVHIIGNPINPLLVTKDEEGNPSGVMRHKLLFHLFEQQLLMPYISISASHREKFIRSYSSAIEKALQNFALDKDFIGTELQPVFRKFN
ncbi:MAG: hypothetical protein RL589_53 [Actinomycetota bacterium]|jgi:glutamate-1-semialdehyde 2,1-aminomutase